MVVILRVPALPALSGLDLNVVPGGRGTGKLFGACAHVIVGFLVPVASWGSPLEEA